APVEIPGPPAQLPPLPGEGPVVLHTPSDSVIKGTETILAAIEEVASRRPLRRRVISGMSHTEVLSEIARADIVIDQMNSETPGDLRTDGRRCTRTSFQAVSTGQRPLSGLVVGLGIMGSHHLRVLHAVEGVEVAAVVDPDPTRRAAAERSWPGVRAYGRLEAA